MLLITMQKQYISDIYPDTISITQVRRDIGALLDKLAREEEVKVLRGQEVLFIASSPASKQAKISKKQKESLSRREKAAEYFFSLKKPTISLSKYIIKERDKMRKKSYYE